MDPDMSVFLPDMHVMRKRTANGLICGKWFWIIPSDNHLKWYGNSGNNNNNEKNQNTLWDSIALYINFWSFILPNVIANVTTPGGPNCISIFQSDGVGLMAVSSGWSSWPTQKAAGPWVTPSPLPQPPLWERFTLEHHRKIGKINKNPLNWEETNSQDAWPKPAILWPHEFFTC